VDQAEPGRGAGFRAEYFDELARLEAENFWFRARNRLLVDRIARHFPHATRFLEVGCGTGFVLRGIADAFPALELTATEFFAEGLSHAARRVPQARLVQADARHMAWDSQFDLVGSFDVLEHVEEDVEVIDGIRRALVPGGGAILTVPQHPLLWSAADTYACHVRRYRRGELEAKLERAGLSVVFSTSFVSLLFPLLLASRLAKRRAGTSYDPHAEMHPGDRANRVLSAVMTLEGSLIRMGVRFPFGGSRLVCVVRSR